MSDSYLSDNQQPIRWIGRHPIYLADYIAAGFGVTMVVTALMSAFGLHAALGLLIYLSPNVLTGQVWRIFTYGLVNAPSIWFVVELLMIVWFGREVEKFFGRRLLVTLFVGLYLTPPVVHTVIGLWQPTELAGESSSLGLFIAFATLYPNALMLFNLLAKWVAWALLGVYSLQTLAVHDWTGLISLWSVAGFAYVFVLYQQGRISLPSPSWPKARTTPATRVEAVRPASSAMAEVDALLDKVAKSGFASLTAKERARLDAAREELRKRAR